MLFEKTQEIHVTSSPAGALVTDDGDRACETPCALVLPKTEAGLYVSKAGYAPTLVAIPHTTHWVAYVLGNLVNGTFGLGMIVDARTGAHRELQDVDVELQPMKLPPLDLPF